MIKSYLLCRCISSFLYLQESVLADLQSVSSSSLGVVRVSKLVQFQDSASAKFIRLLTKQNRCCNCFRCPVYQKRQV